VVEWLQRMAQIHPSRTEVNEVSDFGPQWELLGQQLPASLMKPIIRLPSRTATSCTYLPAYRIILSGPVFLIPTSSPSASHSAYRSASGVPLQYLALVSLMASSAFHLDSSRFKIYIMLCFVCS